jgi:two-component system, LytTR family, sensor kinase
MKKSIALLFNTCYWLVYLFLSARGIFKDDDPVGIWLLNVFNGMFPFFTFYLLLVPRFLAKKKLLPFIGWGMGVIIVAAIMPALLTVFLLSRNASDFITASIQWEMAQKLFLFFSILALANGIMATIIKGFFTWYNDLHEKTELEKKNLQMELSLLKAHLNPHFLFNTLNNIDILIETDPKAASSYLQKLSDILRFVVYETSQEKISLTKELAYIKKYIELQQIRTSNKQYVHLMISGDPGQLMIGPMLFIPFIENAFKHASNKKMNGAITLEISIDDKQIRFNCINIYDKTKTPVEEHSGLGIALLRQRLDLLYKDHYELEITQRENTFCVTAVIKLDGH